MQIPSLSLGVGFSYKSDQYENELSGKGGGGESNISREDGKPVQCSGRMPGVIVC